LSNALYARAGLVGYSGPHYSSFGMKHHFGYTEAGFRACVMEDGPITLAPSPDWSDDAWFLDQEDRRLEQGEGWWVLQEGEADGIIVGGNLCTLNLHEPLMGLRAAVLPPARPQATRRATR